MPDYPGSILRVEYPADWPVAVLTLDAPPLNIVTIPTREHFAATFREIEHNERVRVVIIRTSDNRVVAVVPSAVGSNEVAVAH